MPKKPMSKNGRNRGQSDLWGKVRLSQFSWSHNVGKIRRVYVLQAGIPI